MMGTAKGQRIQIFSPKWERVVLIVGLLPFAFVGWDTGWLNDPWKLRLVADLIFLNVVHNVFSFYIIWRSDEVRDAIRENYGKSWRLHFIGGAIFLASLGAYTLYYYKLIEGPLFYFSVIVGLQFLPIQHAMSQQYGLSRLYDHQLTIQRSLSEGDRTRMSKAARWEVVFHRLALAGMGLRCLWVGDQIYGPGPHWAWIGLAGRTLLAVGVLGVVATCFLRPLWRESNKWVFNLRRVWEFLPTYFNPTFIALQRLNHGLEYLAVTATIERNARRRNTVVVAASIFLGLVAARVVLYIHQIVIRTEANPFDSWTISSDPKLIAFLGASSIALTLTHYYYDSQIYRFSKQAFREKVLPLLAPNGKADPSESKL